MYAAARYITQEMMLLLNSYLILYHRYVCRTEPGNNLWVRICQCTSDNTDVPDVSGFSANGDSTGVLS